jgi:hypothetical protein
MQSAAADLTAEALGQLNKNVLPPKYNSQSVLTFEVTPEGTETADFNLTTKD